jgi:putative endonuclease
MRGVRLPLPAQNSMFFIYILKSLKDNRTYVGYTDNIERRLVEHNSGQTNATKNRRPLELIFSEKVETLKEAKERESYWKSGAGRRKLKIYFEEGFPPAGEARPN